MINDSLSIDDLLMVDKFNVDEDSAHIVLKKLTPEDMSEFHKLELACPAGLYKYDEKGTGLFDYAGCLECGSCRILCGTTILEKWEFPRGTFGVEYRYG